MTLALKDTKQRLKSPPASSRKFGTGSMCLMVAKLCVKVDLFTQGGGEQQSVGIVVHVVRARKCSTM